MSDALTEMTAEAVEVLKKMISIPSFSREEKKVADMLESFLLEKGYAVSRIGNNIWLQSPGFNPSMPTLLLNSHDGWNRFCQRTIFRGRGILRCKWYLGY